MRLAVLEVGSNAIRLASAVWHPSGTLELVLRQHVPLRLGETVFSSGGVSDAALQKRCDALLQIPMAADSVGSFNASVAAGIVLYEVFRQRQ